MMRLARRTVVGLVIGLLASSVGMAQSLYQEGVQFSRLKEAVPVGSGDKIEVIEVFSYACSHCGHLEPTMEKWRATMPKNVKFVALPAIFRDSWAPFARAYYAAEALNIVEKTHSALFRAMYVENKTFNSIDELSAWYAGHGVSAEAFKAAFTANGMEAKLQRVLELTPKYEVEGTPSFVVDGKYKFDVGTAGGMDQIPALLNFLVAKAASERGAKS